MIKIPADIWQQINDRASGERYAVGKTARNQYECCYCNEYINPGHKYYSVVATGSGVTGLIDANRIHPHCLEKLLGRPL